MRAETKLAISVNPDSVFSYSGDPDDMARRRLQQKGDLYEQGGWWKLRWKVDQLGVDGAMKRGWSTPVIVCPSKQNGQMDGYGIREARRKAWETYLSRLDQNTRTPSSAATFAEFVERKYRPEHLNRKEKNTRDSYESILRRYVLPALGEKRLSEIRRDDVQRMLERTITAAGLRTAHLAKAIASGVFHLAEDCEWLATGNPARRCRLPEYKRPEKTALTRDQVDLLIAALDERYRGFVRILALTGMRPGEACGLRWRNVDLAGPNFTIRVAESFTNGHWKASPKRDVHRREIPLTVDAWMAFAELYEASKFNAPDSPVFVSSVGKPLRIGNLGKRYLTPAAKAVGMPWLTFYNLRHTASTNMDQVMTVEEKSRILGHRPEMSTVYTHPRRERMREQLEKATGRVN